MNQSHSSETPREVLTAQLEQYQVLAESSQDFIFIIAPDLTVLYVNAFAASVLNSTPSAIIGSPISSLFSQKSFEQQRASLLRVFSEAQTLNVSSSITVGQKTIWLDNHLIPIVNADGMVEKVLGISRDITDRKNAEQQLSARERLLSGVFASIQDGISVLDKDLNILQINPVMEKWYAHATPFVGKKCYAVYHGQTQPCAICPSITAMRSATTSKAIVPKQNGDGESVGWLDLYSFPMRDDDGIIIGVIEYVRDVTEDQKLEAEIFKVRKLESLGVLAGGIAHDFNNFLTGIQTNIFLAKTTLVPTSDAFCRLTDAENACVRASRLTRQLLTFSKGGMPVKEITDMRSIIEESAGFALVGSKVEYSLSIATDLFDAEVDKGQIDQVLNNLLINALQASADGSVILVSAVNAGFAEILVNIVKQDNRGSESFPALAQQYVKISIADHGTGIPAEIIDKIFDPYFSTKPAGNGLGLSTVYSIVKNHNGYIAVDSREGKGTTFSVYLPSLAPKVLPVDSNMVKPATQQNGKILVMDDDPIVQTVYKQLLTRNGYSATLAYTGSDAIALYKKAFLAKEPFLAVIMDLTIAGGMGGKEAVKEVLAFDPGARVIVASGYSNDAVVLDYRAYGFCGFLTKPFKIDDFLKVIKTVIS